MEVLRGPSPARSASTQLLVGPGWQEQSGSWAGGCDVEEKVWTLCWQVGVSGHHEDTGPGRGSLSCAGSGFLEAEVGPVHSHFLTCLLCRIQTEPLEVFHLPISLIHLHPIHVLGQEHVVQGGG